MKYSFIIPVYNGEKYLAECLESILTQTVEDYEIVLIDDGSADGSLNICMAYAQRYSNIHVLRQKNAGVSAARNHGLSEAKGEYICFVDCDDKLSPYFLAEAERCGDYDILFFDFTRKEEALAQNLSVTGKIVLCSDEQQALVDKVLYDSRQSFTNLNCNTVWGKVFARRAIHMVRFPEGIPIGEDKIFNFQVFTSVSSMVYLPVCLYYCRSHKASVMRQYAVGYTVAAEKTFLLFEQLMQKQNLKQKEHYNRLLAQRTVPVLRNILELEICHKKNKTSFWEKRRAWRDLMTKGKISMLFARCSMERLSKRDAFYLWVYRHGYMTVRLLTKNRLIRAVWYGIYRIFKGWGKHENFNGK